MTTRTITAAVLLMLLALSAALFLAADLGIVDAGDELTGIPAPIRVYATGETGAPTLNDDIIARWDDRLDVLCALSVREVPATLWGPGWAVPVTLMAVPEDELPLTGLTLSSGDFPDSAWENQGLLGAETAAALEDAVQQAGLSFPSRVKLSIGSREACDSAGIDAVDISLSGTVSDDGALPGIVIMTDTVLLTGFIENNEAFCLDQGIDAAPIRTDLYLRASADRTALAQSLRDLGYLVTDPLTERDAVLAAGSRMKIRWGALAAVLATACLVSARSLWVHSGIKKTALVSAAAATAGILMAMIVMQTAMLLGWDFIADSRARYLMSLPRALAVFALCMAAGVTGHIRRSRQKTVSPVRSCLSQKDPSLRSG